jgi:hypothetical protein
MRNISLCILNQEEGWNQAFLRAAALDHPGFSVTFKLGCGEDCARNYDACLPITGTEPAPCPCTFVSASGRYAGVTALLAEAKIFAASRLLGTAAVSGDFAMLSALGEPDGARIVCVHARAGGAGASCAAIGIGRELARYRDAKAVYLCLTDLESAALLPAVCEAAMPAETLLYRCRRLAGRGEDTAALETLIRAAALPDEYGLLRFGAGRGVNAFSALTAPELAGLIVLLERAVGPAFFVLDFGTRQRLLEDFCEICEAACVEASRAVFPECPEDIRTVEGRIGVSLTNAFGSQIKKWCDSLLGV